MNISKGKIESILDLTQDGIVAVDQNGIITVFNRAAEGITGLKADAVRGKRVVDVIHNTRLHLVVENGTPELNRRQKIGDTVIITNRFPVHDGDGNIAGAVAVFRDITEITALSDQVSDLWKARTLLQAVIECSEDAISVADEKGKNIIVNPAYTRITGLPKEAVINKPVTVDIADNGESMHMKVLQTGKPVHHVSMKVGPMKREVIVNVAPIFIEGKIKGSVGVIRDISEIISLTEELTRAKTIIRHLQAKYTWDDIIGESPPTLKAKEQAQRAAATPATVLLLGGSGTGKELFAHAIHNASARRNGQFVRVNCAALSESLLESELFGYEEGAFTGAKKGGKKGLFEEADGGTLFLDEISEISLHLQSKLLRAMAEGEIRRVGSTGTVPVDVRIIAATNADLKRKMQDGSFREDLYYRLNVVPIKLMTLRERKEDIPPLVEQIIFRLNQIFGREVKGIAPGALEVLLDYAWPGNIRELENVLGRAIINMRPQEVVIESGHLPLMESRADENRLSQSISQELQPLEKTLAEAERNAIARSLEDTGGNRQKAAQMLGISLRSLYYKMGRHGIK